MKTRFGGLWLVGCLMVTGLMAQERPDALELYRQGQYGEAVGVCQQELEQWESDQVRQRMDSYTVMGWSYLRLGRYNDALTMSREARNVRRYDARIVEIQAESLYYLGRNIEALETFEEYVSLPNSSDRLGSAYYFMGEIFLQLAEYQHADIAFATALHASPQAAGWWVRLGYAREQLENVSGAQAAYSRALELKPSLEEARTGLERLQS